MRMIHYIYSLRDRTEMPIPGKKTTVAMIPLCFFQMVCTSALWIGDLGGHTPHGQGPGGVSGPGGKTADRTAPTEETEQEVDIHLGGKDTGGGGVLDDGVIH